MSSDDFKQRRHDATAEVLIAAAETAIAAKGYDKVTMRDIAAEAGCTPGTLYLYFKRKQDLVIAILERHSDAALDGFGSALAVADGPIAKLHSLVETAVDHFHRNRTLFRVLSSWTRIRPPQLPSELPPSIAEKWQGFWQQELDIIRQAQAAGQIRNDFPPESIQRFMQGLILGVFESLTAQETLPPREELVRTLWGFLTGGIGARRDHAQNL